MTNELSTKDGMIKKLEQRVDQLEESTDSTEQYSDCPNLRDHASGTYGGQNGNQDVAALLMYASQTTQLDRITHNNLESGHSYVKCNVSACIQLSSARRSMPMSTP